MNPFDLLRIDHAFWEVRAIHLGAEGQESVIECVRLDARPNEAGGGRLFLPELMLRHSIEALIVEHYGPVSEE